MAGRDDKEPPMVRPLPTADVSPRRLASSESTKQLTTALRLARKEFGKVAKDKQNTYQKNWYATLHSVLAAVDDALAGHGLLIIHSTRWEGGELWLDTTLEHESGEWIASVYPLFASNYSDPQRVGSCLTYARRYVVLSMLGIAPEDDDGVSAMDRGHGRQERPAARHQERRPEPPAPDRRAVNEAFQSHGREGGRPPATPNGSRETWSQWIGKRLAEVNAEWGRELTREDVGPQAFADYGELSNEPREVNYLCTRLIDMGRLTEDEIGKDADPSARDSAKARAAVVALFKGSPNSVKRAVEKHLKAKRIKAREDLGMPQVESDDDAAEMRQEALSN